VIGVAQGQGQGRRAPIQAREGAGEEDRLKGQARAFKGVGRQVRTGGGEEQGEDETAIAAPNGPIAAAQVARGGGEGVRGDGESGRGDVQVMETIHLPGPGQGRAIRRPGGVEIGAGGVAADIAEALVLGQIEVGEPDFALAAARGNKGHLAAEGRPGRAVVGGWVIGQADGVAAICHRQDEHFQVFIQVGFVSQPAPIWRPGGAGFVRGGIGEAGDQAADDIELVQVPIAVAVGCEGDGGAIRAEGGGDIVPGAISEAREGQRLRGGSQRGLVGVKVLIAALVQG